MIRVVVIGLRLESLIATWVLRQHPYFDVWLIADKDPATLCTNGHDRQCLVPHTASMGNLLRALKVIYSTFTPQDGILLRGRIEEFPRGLSQLSREDAARVASDACAKAGEPYLNGKTPQRRPRRLRCASDELVRALSDRARVLTAPIWQLEPGAVIISGNRRFEYDFAIVTDPVWELCSRVWFEVPRVAPDERTIAQVTPRRLSPFRRWDVVLTPYTPADAAFRVTMRGNDLAIEMRGEVDTKVMLSDLNFLFPDGYALQTISIEEASPKKIETVRWPENIVPLGSLAEGRTARPLDEVLDGTYALMRKWTRTR